jgi:acetyltransferase-like isoleucine patch superfamily enzyme
VVVGRYVSTAVGVRVFTQNHPFDRLSMHPFFYDPGAGFVAEKMLPPARLWIGHDAWLGAAAIVTPGCSRIGIGAVVGAGAVVTQDVDDFAIVAGNPARTLRYRFTEETCGRILGAEWWQRPLAEVRQYIDDLTRPLDDWPLTHPLLGSDTSVRSR